MGGNLARAWWPGRGSKLCVARFLGYTSLSLRASLRAQIEVCHVYLEQLHQKVELWQFPGAPELLLWPLVFFSKIS
jgi:hypothetical protein